MRGIYTVSKRGLHALVATHREKMADLFILDRVFRRRALRRERVFRDRTHPLEVYDDEEIVRRFRFDRNFIFELAEEIRVDLEYEAARPGALTPVLQVCLALRFFATGAFQNVVGDLIGISQPTACRTINRVTNALYVRVHQWVHLPDQAEADTQKRKFFDMRGFPNVVGCIDGTHIRIQAPADGHENDYVNRKNFHSINVQVICDADLKFVNIVARWPGSVHDARILRNSPVFTTFEGNRPPLDGLILGDSGYMLRTWLMTPILRAATPAQRRYNFAHRSTRCTVERALGVAKQRWQCLRMGLRVQPQKACRIIMVCMMLHNRAQLLNLPPPLDAENGEDDAAAGDDEYQPGNENLPNERARAAAGNRVRQRIIIDNFTHMDAPADG